MQNTANFAAMQFEANNWLNLKTKYISKPEAEKKKILFGTYECVYVSQKINPFDRLI